jgi:hypothetical protein
VRQALRGEDGRLTVVAQGCKLNVKNASLILANTSHADSVSTAKVAVQTGLRTVRLIVTKDLDSGLRCRRAPESLGLTLVIPKSLANLLS